MDAITHAKIEADARELLRITFLDDKVSSEIYCRTHDLYTAIMLLGIKPPKKTLFQRLFRK